MKIVTAPNAVLSIKANPVEAFDKKLIELVHEMEKTLDNTRDPEGVGLAAPQIGVSLQIFIMKPTPKAKTTVCINPKIQKQDEIAPSAGENTAGKQKTKSKKSKKLEGCLSLPNIWGEVRRNNLVTMTFFDETGKKHTRTFKGFSATIVQHEYDHLHGILFPKHVLEQHNQLYESHKDEKGEDVFEEIKI